MPNLQSRLKESAPTLDQHIKYAQTEINKLEVSIADLSAAGHDVTGPVKHLNCLLENVGALVKLKMEQNRPPLWHE
jgi:hypothetical protein